MPVAQRAIEMVHDEDPKDTIRKAVGPYLDAIEVMGARILIGVYQRPEKTAGGIILTGDTRNEDRYQGKIGLILKMGPLAFQDDASHSFGPNPPKVGDWVLCRVGDTYPLLLGKHTCRFAEDVAVQAVVKRPDMVF